MRRVIKSGDTYEVSVFPVGDNTRPRGKRKGEYTPRKQDANDKLAIRRVTRTLNCNFKPRDYLLTIPHLPGTTLAQARAADKLYIKRIVYHAAKLGIKVKWLMVTSDIDPRTGEHVSSRTGELIEPHTHIILTAVDEGLIHKLWKFGGVDIRHLRDQGDYTAIAVYFIKQCRRDDGAKGYTSSRGLIKPEIISEEIISNPAAEIKIPKGAVVVERSAFDIDHPTQYVRYVLKKQQRKRKRE